MNKKTHRIRTIDGFEDVVLTKGKAIKLKCFECSGYSYHEAKLCTVELCPLYPYRDGKDPFRKNKVWTEEEKARQRETLAKNLQKLKT